MTHNGVYTDGTPTYGGYSDIMVTNEHYVVHWPENLPMEAAPLLCAGITTYSPLRYFGLDKPGMHIGVVGLGGLGHMAVKFAKAFGTKVTVISTSGASGSLDGIINTVSAIHTLLPLINLLKTHGKLVMVGAPEKPLELPVFPLLLRRKLVAGSAIGRMKETQEMVDFAAKHNITPDVEVVPMDYVNTALERLLKSDVKYRFVLDIGNTLNKN
uniref:Cinnamyl alcohol dehydrogenase n=1 Tax=Solanum tuberosum TaxID=4113 RepID=M1D408_SOLTU